MIAVALIGRPFGVDGLLRVTAYSGEYGHLVGLTDVELRSDDRVEVATVRRFEVRARDALVGFDGITSPEAARRFTGWEIWVPRGAGAPLGPDEHYVADIVGMDVICQEIRIGHVVAVVDGAQAPLLEVRVDGRNGTALLPFMDRFVDTVDVARRCLTVRERWMLDLS